MSSFPACIRQPHCPSAYPRALDWCCARTSVCVYLYNSFIVMSVRQHTIHPFNVYESVYSQSWANMTTVSFRTFALLQKETFTLQQSISRVRFAPETKPAGACGLLNEQTVGPLGRPAHCIA